MNRALVLQQIFDARIHAEDLSSELEDLRRSAKRIGLEDVAERIMEIAQDVDNAAGALEGLANSIVTERGEGNERT